MAKKFKTSKNKSEIEALQAIENKANRLPSPPSMFIHGVLMNVCPICKAPATNYPWSCTVCDWTATANPVGCCIAIQDIQASDEGDFAIEIDEDSDYENSELLNESEKDAWRAAKNRLIDDLPKPPIWSSAKRN